MPMTATPFWENALQSLQREIAVRPMSDAVLAESQERILRYRDHLEHAAVRSKYRSSSFQETDPALPAIGQRDLPRYRALLLTTDGRIAGTAKLMGENDDDALQAAAALADGQAVDLWDGLRFIEHFEATRVAGLKGP